tara:strand:+ start:12501 stop:12929 length:429 start_codon:yes stop_codon:yes gene_type:complete
MFLRSAILPALFVTLSACDMSPDSAYGFRLPEGDAEVGKAVFEEKQCATCHIIGAFPELRDNMTDPEMNVAIGGLQTRIATHGELVSAVINPSHKIARGYKREPYVEDGQSAMRTVNEQLTVAELIDLVAFLQDQYEEFPDY